MYFICFRRLSFLYSLEAYNKEYYSIFYLILALYGMVTLEKYGRIINNTALFYNDLSNI